MSLRHLSVRVGKNRGFLSRVERNLQGASEQTLQAIAAVLETPLQAIVREDMS